jgi:uncharacterized protein (DUF1778 family)
MPATAAKPHARAVNLRMRDDVRDLIDRAARAHGKSRSDFMIDASRRAAEDALLDQTLLHVGREAFAWHLDVLGRPPSGEGHDRLMAAKTPWKS